MASRRPLCYITTFFILSFFTFIYFSYFKHPPPEELMRMNSNRFGAGRGQVVVARGIDVNDSSEEDSDVAEITGRKIVDKGRAKWEKFIKDNSFVSIGSVFTTCDPTNQQTVGTVVMLKDEVYGGVKTRTFMNFTLEEDVGEGSEFYIDVKYNDNGLYDNHWDLCEVEEEEDEREIYCPVSKGEKTLISDKKIPIYLPKGHYRTAAWIKNPKGDDILCGYADFVL